MRLLLTNDDGYQAAGLRTLVQELRAGFEITVVAPRRQRSWIGKALTNAAPLTISTERVDGVEYFVVTDGTPADCVNLGLYHLCPDQPDLVLSGINNGANFTNSLALASGTVGGALEAALNGVLGIALSLDLDAETEKLLRGDYQHAHLEIFAPAARVVHQFLREWLAHPVSPHVKLVNLIVPQQPTLPLRFVECPPQPYVYGSVFEKNGAAFVNRGRGYLEDLNALDPTADISLVRNGIVAYTLYSGNLESLRDSRLENNS